MKLLFTSLILLMYVSISLAQESKPPGKVQVFVKPESATINLNDSILQQGKVYSFPEGIYELRIENEGYKDMVNSYFQIFSGSSETYKYKLKVAKPEKLVTFQWKNVLVPTALSAIAGIGLNYLLFPVEDLNGQRQLIEDYESQLSDLQISGLPNWNLSSQEQIDYQNLKSSYEREVADYNDRADTNNSNRNSRVILPIALAGVTGLTTFILELNSYSKKKKSLQLNFNPVQTSLTYQF